MQQITLAVCHQVLSKPVGELNQMELAIRKRLEEIYGKDLEKFALYAKFSVELDPKGELGSQVIKI